MLQRAISPGHFAMRDDKVSGIWQSGPQSRKLSNAAIIAIGAAISASRSAVQASAAHDQARRGGRATADVERCEVICACHLVLAGGARHLLETVKHHSHAGGA